MPYSWTGYEKSLDSSYPSLPSLDRVLHCDLLKKKAPPKSTSWSSIWSLISLSLCIYFFFKKTTFIIKVFVCQVQVSGERWGSLDGGVPLLTRALGQPHGLRRVLGSASPCPSSHSVHCLLNVMYEVHMDRKICKTNITFSTKLLGAIQGWENQV